MFDAARVAFLRSREGEQLARYAAGLPSDPLRRLTLLRRTVDRERAAAIVELLELRARGAAKFSRADGMFFTAQGLEQSSGEATARWRAARFPAGADILDLCSGIGGDAMALAARGPVLAFDIDPAAAACARANGELSADRRISVACADVTRLRLRGAAAFIDPSRRREGRRVRHGDLYSPPLSFVAELARRVPAVAAKVSPALDDALDALGGRVEFVSDRGECKEAVVWFGDIGPAAGRSAAVLPAGATLSAADVPPAPVSAPRSWLYEPDPAVIRAHLVAEAAALLGASQLDPQIAFLTADDLVHTPLVRAYRLIEWLPFSLRQLRARLRALGFRAEAVKRRGVPMEPADILRSLPSEGDRSCVVVLTRVGGAPAALIVQHAEHLPSGA